MYSHYVFLEWLNVNFYESNMKTKRTFIRTRYMCFKDARFPSFLCVYTIEKLHPFKYARYIIIRSLGVSGMWSCTRLIMWWNATRCISVLFEIWSRHMSSCVSIWASFLTKELSRHSLWFSADYWRQKFLQKHHTLTSLCPPAWYTLLLSSFFPSLL